MARRVKQEAAGEMEPLTQEEQDRRLLARAEKGDTSITRAQVKQALDRLPGPPPARLGRIAENALLGLLGKDNLVKQEQMRREVEHVRRMAAGADPSPLEALLADRAAICWLQVQMYEAMHAVALGSGTVAGSLAHQKRIESAQRRYLAAIKALARVRRLQLPALQVNIGEKQINVIGNQQVPNAGSIEL